MCIPLVPVSWCDNGVLHAGVAWIIGTEYYDGQPLAKRLQLAPLALVDLFINLAQTLIANDTGLLTANDQNYPISANGWRLPYALKCLRKVSNLS